MNEKDLELFKLIDNTDSFKYNKKEEIFLYDDFISRYYNDTQYDNNTYVDLFNSIISKRLLTYDLQ